jgi:glycosyltransferase involved in cell wall biosynthesis
MAAVEAQAAGRPVIAVDAGGARETVLHGRTGWLVPNGDSSSMARALRRDLSCFDSQDIRAHAQNFGHEVFETQLREIVEAG